jgi:ribose transport system substrate-binding protein
VTTQRRRTRRPALVASAAAALLLAAGCSSGSGSGGTTGGETSDINADNPACGEGAAAVEALQPDDIVGEGPNGEASASPDDVAISDADAQKIRDGKFKIALVFQFADDWSNTQARGLKDEFSKYGVEIISNTQANFKVDQQIANIQNAIQLHPDGMVSIPVDDVATAPAYKKVGQAGIKLVFMDNAAKGLKAPADYQSVISADSQGNGQIAAAKLACYIPEDGTIGIVDFGITFFVTNQRTKGVKDWFAENRPDIKIKEAKFTDPNQAGDVAANFLTANPDVEGVFAVWDDPAMGVISALRAQNRKIPVTTIDIGSQAAVEVATGEYLKGIGAQRPYDQGVTEARAMMLSLIGKDVPDWIGVPSLAVTQSNLTDGWQAAEKAEPPKAAVEACEANPDCA